MNNCQVCNSKEHLTGNCEGYGEWIKKPHPKKEVLIENNKEGQRKHYKNLLFRFKEDCYKEMVILDSELSLTNTQFNKLFEDLINKSRKNNGKNNKN